MESLKSSFLFTSPLLPSSPSDSFPIKLSTRPRKPIHFSFQPDPWSLNDGDYSKPKPRSKNPKKPLSDDNARRIIKAKAQYLSVLRRNQGPQAQTPKWIKRTPEQMVQYLQDDRHGHLYGKHVVAAIKKVRALSQKTEGGYDMRMVMGSFVGKLTFREMCVVLKEQKGWRQVRDFFAWMKLQLSYRPSVIAYTIVLRVYGQVGKLNLAEEIFLEMLEVECEPDEVACGTMLCSYARWGRHKAMLSFYSAVKERGIILSVAVFNFMLSSLQKKSLHREVIEMWMEMMGKGVVPNNFTYTVVISSLVKEGLHEDAFKTFNEMKNSGFVPEEVTYSLLISSSAKNGNKDEALRLYEDMRSQEIVPSNYTCASLLSLYYKYEDYSKALSLFSEMESKKIAADEVIYGLLIRIYGKLGLFEDAQKTFQETEQLGLLTDEKTYLAMAQVHLNSGNVDKSLEIIELMKSRNIWFSRFAYIVLLQCYVMKEDLVSAEATFLALSKTGLPDAGSCNDMLNLYMGLDSMERAKEFIARIRKEQIYFDVELYKTVMKVYCKEGMLKDAERLTREMGANKSFKDKKFIRTIYRTLCGHEGGGHLDNTFIGIDQPDTMALSLMLSLYLENGNTSRIQDILKLLLGTAGGSMNATQLLKNLTRDGDTTKAESLTYQLSKLGCRMEEAAVASLIGYYGKQRMLKQAREIFAAFADSPTSSKLIYKSMIDVYAKCDRHEEAYLLYQQVTEEGCDPGPVAVSIVVNALINGGKHQETENIIHKSFEDNLELDTVAYNTFIKAMLEAGKLDFASSIYERMCSMGVAPSIQTYNTMISVYGQDQKLDRAIEIFDLAQSSGVYLDGKTYMNMISYYGKAGKRNEASLLFSKMQEKGIKPGKVSYNIMINVYARAGHYHEVEKLLKAMQRDGYIPDSFTYLSLIRAYTESLKYSEAEEIINAMRNKGVTPSCAHFNLLLGAFTKAGMLGEAERVYKELQNSGLNPDLICLRTMVRGYLDYGLVDEGSNFFECVSEFTKGDRFIMSAAVHLYKSAGKDNKAEVILNSMDNLGIPFLRKLEVGSKLKAL
ncbi:Pentatricopeptide repeat-containing protein [Quillaja saponaria]|uniref:Pentatricopeptide repeat-containing protein n=1 Tax=Quillaja saponaria TaxID=32244 RepID=A0AAD7PJB4_QUISA|nr:Pentatricopeptide repeat-containing protein [Quillaja saponaria]